MDSINRRVADTVNTSLLELKRIALVADFVDSMKVRTYQCIGVAVACNVIVQ